VENLLHYQFMRNGGNAKSDAGGALQTGNNVTDGVSSSISEYNITHIHSICYYCEVVSLWKNEQQWWKREFGRYIGGAGEQR
jgi:hypothetical protein